MQMSLLMQKGDWNYSSYGCLETELFLQRMLSTGSLGLCSSLNQQAPFIFNHKVEKRTFFSFSLSRNPNYKYCWVTLSLFEEGNAIPLWVECRRFMKKKRVEKWIIAALDLIFSSFYNVLPCLTCLLYKHLYSWLRVALWTPRCIINVKVEGIMLQMLLPLLGIAFLKPI